MPLAAFESGKDMAIANFLLAIFCLFTIALPLLLITRGDKAEAKAVKAVFKDHAYNLNINSTKSMTGHLLGAAGAIEAISCVLSINNNIVPPTINHFSDDPEIDNKLNFTFNTSQKRDVKVAMSNTFGFGGHNACVLLKEFVD